MSSTIGQARELKDSPECWPALPLESWEPTRATLHMWTQIVGKVRLALTPLVNHWWNVPLYVTARGLTTSLMQHSGGERFQIGNHRDGINGWIGANGIASRLKMPELLASESKAPQCRTLLAVYRLGSYQSVTDE